MLLSDIVHFAAGRRPGHAALHFADRTITFAELSDRVHRVANAFGAAAEPGETPGGRGVSPRQGRPEPPRIAILADNCPEYVECLYGIPEAGLAVTMVNQRLTAGEIEAILTDAEPAILVVGANHADRIAGLALPSVRRRLVIGEAGEGDSYDAFVAGAAASPPPGPVAEDSDLAWLIYTSGTTGRPKGAMLTHRNVLTAIVGTAMEWHPSESDVALFVFPLCHVAAFVPLLHHLHGGTVVLGAGFVPGEFLALIEKHQVTHAGLAPTMINFLLRDPACEAADTSSLRMLPYGASAIAPDLLARAIGRFGPLFVQGYGMTEVSGNVLVLDRDEHRRGLDGEPHLLGAAGRATKLANVRVVDDALEDVPAGQVGEIVVRGDQVTRGYWRNPEATAEAWAGGWFHTGDLATVDDAGYVSVVDRKKDMVVTGGENVYPREVEDVLAGLPGVVDAAVIGLPDPEWGEAVTAVVVAEGAMEADDVRLGCRSFLAGYKVPRQVLFTDALPRNASGKVLKRELRALYSAKVGQ
jgi:acyl-CoA synthetase (AMP-forming)/AMP-acid ligase II